MTYPATAPEIAIPELDGKTAKMYRGGKICLTDHFKPLWGKNVPKFGIAHAMALGVRHGFTLTTYLTDLNLSSQAGITVYTLPYLTGQIRKFCPWKKIIYV